MLTVKNLGKTYKTGDRALNDVSFTVEAGQVVGLIGPSGAGKSTLIRCVNRLVEPTAGTDLSRRHGTHRPRPVRVCAPRAAASA